MSHTVAQSHILSPSVEYCHKVYYNITLWNILSNIIIYCYWGNRCQLNKEKFHLKIWLVQQTTCTPPPYCIREDTPKVIREALLVCSVYGHFHQPSDHTMWTQLLQDLSQPVLDATPVLLSPVQESIYSEAWPQCQPHPSRCVRQLQEESTTDTTCWGDGNWNLAAISSPP